MNKYKRIRAVGHREIEDLFNGEVIVQEKIDGSNFGFGLDYAGVLHCVSRTQDINLDNPEKSFAPAVEYIKSIQHLLPPGLVFRCEYLRGPKHNVLSYKRAPKNYLVLFEIDDVGPDTGVYSTRASTPFQLSVAGEQLGIETVPTYFLGIMLGSDLADSFNNRWSKYESLLGGPIEGVVVKNYNRFTADGNILAGKFVRAEFKESHSHLKCLEKSDPVCDIGAKLGGPARWAKAVQRLRDEGVLQNGPEDIPALMRRVQIDVEEEEAAAIKEALWTHFRKNVIGASSRGLPVWYKEKLAGG